MTTTMSSHSTSSLTEPMLAMARTKSSADHQLGHRSSHSRRISHVAGASRMCRPASDERNDDYDDDDDDDDDVKSSERKPLIFLSDQVELDYDEEIASVEADGTEYDHHDTPNEEDTHAHNAEGIRSSRKSKTIQNYDCRSLIGAHDDIRVNHSSAAPPNNTSIVTDSPLLNDLQEKKCLHEDVQQNVPSIVLSTEETATAFGHDEQQVLQEAHTLLEENNKSHHTITPPSSESSSFSSVDSVTHRDASENFNYTTSDTIYNAPCDSLQIYSSTHCNIHSSLHNSVLRHPEQSFHLSEPDKTALISNTTGTGYAANKLLTRTIYPRASKLATATKVVAVLDSPVKSSSTPMESLPPSSSSFPMPLKKRKIENIPLPLGQVSPCVHDVGQTSTQSSNTSQQVQQLMAKEVTALPTSFSTGPYSGEGVTENSSPVPNPLDRLDNPNKTLPLSHSLQQQEQSTNCEIEKMKSIMLSLPKTVPSSIAASGVPSTTNTTDTNDSFFAIANSISQQKYQVDGITSCSSLTELASQQGRGRIFSIDLDPSVLDFVESVVDPLGVSEFHVSSDNTCRIPDSKSYSVTFKGIDEDAQSCSVRGSYARDRGFSFEFFSFGINEDEPLPAISGSMCNNYDDANDTYGVTSENSFIFDSSSFQEGGIHETSALMHTNQESTDASSQGAVDGHARVPHRVFYHGDGNISHDVHGVSPTLEMQSFTNTTKEIDSRQSKMITHSKHRMNVKPMHDIGNVASNKISSSCGQNTIKSSSSHTFPIATADGTIHMPHGSDAAAAAAIGMVSSSLTASSESYGNISHTSCPMDLLNKGGRIGIYLPEERQARIAKFHYKRKQRMWRKRIKYDCRKKLADSRPRIKGRFVKRSDLDEEE